jgi:hypothetical protein
MNEAFTFDEDAHLYRLADGTIIPGHTRVLDLGGLCPYKFIDADIIERKGVLGKEAHYACHLYDQGKKLKVDKRVEPRLAAWIAFRRETKFVPILREHRDVYRLNGLAFGMQIDAMGLLDGRETLVELKTCTQIYPHHGVQLAAQAACVNHSKLTSPDAKFFARQRIVVQLNDNGKFRRYDFEDRLDLQAFRSALYTSYWKLQHDKTYKGELTR